MIIALVIVAVVAFAAGFTVKHYLTAGKLASIEAELLKVRFALSLQRAAVALEHGLVKIEAAAVSDAKAVVAAVRSKL